MVKETAYVVLQAFMVNELKLKGNALTIYAIIYGFSQTKNQCFTGSLQYLQDWTQSTRQGVIKAIQYLLDRGLIKRQVSHPTNKYYATYLDFSKDVIEDESNEPPIPFQSDEDNNVNNEPEEVTKFTVNSVTEDVNSVNVNSKLSLHNNTIYTNKNNKDVDNYLLQKDLDIKVSNLISYLNNKCHTNFKTTVGKTKRMIRGRLKEGFTEEDIKKVIDKKYIDWGVNPYQFSNGQMSNSYLRPSTLFGNNFESYLYEANLAEQSAVKSVRVSQSVEVDPNRSTVEF